MRLLVDMNLSPHWIPFLASHGIEAIHWSNLGAAVAPDSEILAYASLHQFVIFTHDLDFGMLLAQSKESGPSVIQIRAQDVLPESIGAILLQNQQLSRAIGGGRDHDRRPNSQSCSPAPAPLNTGNRIRKWRQPFC